MFHATDILGMLLSMLLAVVIFGVPIFLVILVVKALLKYIKSK